MAARIGDVKKPQRVGLYCQTCRRGRGNHGELRFAPGHLNEFVFTCPRGHTWKVRRRSNADIQRGLSAWVATPWELDEAV